MTRRRSASWVGCARLTEGTECKRRYLTLGFSCTEHSLFKLVILTLHYLTLALTLMHFRPWLLQHFAE